MLICLSVCGSSKAEVDSLSQMLSTTRDEVVPCDCLLLQGAAVVNEASLTGQTPSDHGHAEYLTSSSSIIIMVSLIGAGESVPQMKEALSVQGRSGSADEGAAAAESGRLDMQGLHRVHVLFSGSSLITVDSGKERGHADQTSR